MELARLIEALTDPAAYPGVDGVEGVEVHQTHISAVFLAGRFAFKLKKPLDLGFLDFSTPERRRHFCEQELRLNRRLAPGVYLEVVPVVSGVRGIEIGGQGEVIDWAVKMQRLPEAATLRERLRLDEVGPEVFEALARRLADFHTGAESGPTVSAWGRFEVVAGNALENFEQSAAHVGQTISGSVFERLRVLTESTLARLRPTIEARAARDVPRDGHGDLRLDHIYLFPDRTPPEDLLILDCIEFNERFRQADPVADIAFLVMDLIRNGRRDLARDFADAYFRASGDAEGRSLLPFYTAYRAAIRGKVDGMELSEPEIPEAERSAARDRARAHWLMALVELEAPSRRPCLTLVGGLPGTGKSTLARGLAARAGFEVIRSDEVRKQLAGLDPGSGAASAFESGLYTPEWTGRTYRECRRRAEALLFEGRRVLIDASFRDESDRRLLLDAAGALGVPSLLLLCEADPEIVRHRLEHRRGDVSDADWSVYLQAAARWPKPGPSAHAIDTGRGPDPALDRALAVHEVLGLWEPDSPKPAGAL